MASSGFGMSEYKSALLKKFQGNGWELTYASASQNELAAIIGDEISAATQEGKAPARQLSRESAPQFPIIRYQLDWADTVLDRCLHWQADGTIPLWVTKATEHAECALFQLPPPDGRWVVKFAGKILEPFNPRLSGWTELHEIMVHGFLRDRTELIAERMGLSDLREQSGDLLRSAELVRTEYGPNNEKISDINCSVTGARLHGPDVKMRDGTVVHDIWHTCANDFNKQVRDRLDRVFKAIKRKDKLAATVIKEALHFRNGKWTFTESTNWMTTLGEIPYDATMILTGKQWEIDFPESSERLVVPDSAGMRAIARVLMCSNSACPCALLSEGELLNDFLSRPRHHKYFEAIHRRPSVTCGDSANSEVEHAVCAAMRFKPGWYYRADHVITQESELHTVCKLPTGRVTLRKAEAIEGVRDLIKKQQARLFFLRPPTQQFIRVLADIEAGIEFARKQEKLLEQVQPKSEEYQAKIQRAFYRTRDELGKMGDWTTRYDRLADHLSEYIKGGTVFQYTGSYRWGVEGIAQTPDPLELAADHKAFKRSRVAKLMKKAKARMQAIHSLNMLSKGAAV